MPFHTGIVELFSRLPALDAWKWSVRNAGGVHSFDMLALKKIHYFLGKISVSKSAYPKLALESLIFNDSFSI